MVLACALVFMAQLATTVYLPSLPAVMHDFAVSRGCAELSISMFVIGAAAPVVLWGRAADRYGRRGPLLCSLVLFVVSSALLAVSGSPAALLVLRTVQGVAAGGSAIVARIMVRDRWSGDELARRLSVLSIAFISAMGGGQFLGGLIARYSHWRTGFWVLAAIGAGAALLALTVPFEPGRAERSSGGTAGTRLGILRQPGFLRPACAGGLGFATVVMLQEVSPFVFQQRFGLDADAYGSVGLLLGLAYFSGAMAVNRLVGRVGAGRLMRAGALVMTASAVLIAVLWSVAGLPPGAGLVLFAVLYCALTFGQSVLFPSSTATAVSSIGAERGTYAVALCGFLQQSMAGVAAAGAAVLHHNLAWASVAVALCGSAWLLVRGCAPR
ncbi:MFS transporter [Streptomyces albus subsp. albus]|nr:MFS transporter [Streptomyces albus subsp. albus]